MPQINFINLILQGQLQPSLPAQSDTNQLTKDNNIQLQNLIDSFRIINSTSIHNQPHITYKSSSDNKLFRELTTDKHVSTNQALDASILLKLPNSNTSQSTGNITCIQQQQTVWSNAGCQTLKNTGINGYYCYLDLENYIFS
ncbi:hypothetical protein ABPG72_009453 [Tetrahymena utriculariae]